MAGRCGRRDRHVRPRCAARPRGCARRALRFGICNNPGSPCASKLEPNVLKDFSEAFLPGVLGQTPAMSRPGNFQAGFRPPPVKAEYFHQFSLRPVTEDFAAQFVKPGWL